MDTVFGASHEDLPKTFMRLVQAMLEGFTTVYADLNSVSNSDFLKASSLSRSKYQIIYLSVRF